MIMAADTLAQLARVVLPTVQPHQQWGNVLMTQKEMVVTTPVSFHSYLIGLVCDSGGGTYSKGISYNSEGKINVYSSAASSGTGNVGTNWLIACS